mmetsp:Transcript_15559/g.44615  ORF Transcript_15559/g.44615 Transcript_15559/m.44615 type:complete len:80 (+) Transcript_15559:32-271(+)
MVQELLVVFFLLGDLDVTGRLESLLAMLTDGLFTVAFTEACTPCPHQGAVEKAEATLDSGGARLVNAKYLECGTAPPCL